MGCFYSKNLREKKANSTDLQNKKIEFRYDDGRRFHCVDDAIYYLPNDEDEQDRLHLQHFLIRYIFQSNFSAPIKHLLEKPGTKILDIGCGPGSWSFDIATTYPNVEVIGLDISSHQPEYIKPKNFSFVKANVFEGIPFEDNTFDFVFQRFLVFGYPEDKWPNVINELVRVLKPGGFIELCEPSVVRDAGPTTQFLWDAELDIVKQKGIDPQTYQMIEKYLQNQGQLENIVKEVKECHHGAKSENPKLSKVAISNLISLYESLKPSLVKHLQISDEEFDKLIKTSEKELFDFDTYYYMVRVYASKSVDENEKIQNNT
ncbi:S-adenosyl-L-methionine-dependent methyltransferase [Gigaspora rosea]|uniref:S-adenosyl-L-methionine-dependent methyltransferase n=1 Tax=Gigaspora rosea TaxID=44941 RepID=A0A397UGJ3_9GLOM|nr:S-adenosyl-L-methionine-dependent methyltransferase [Gigaspora rosea]